MSKYENGTKQTWRGWVWNRLAERIPPGSTVIVLAGDGGFDFSHGSKKGFEVIGCDLNKSCVNAFEKIGGIAIQDRIEEQIKALKPDAAILDFTGGFSEKTSYAIQTANTHCKVVAVNLLRGRDPFAVDIREWQGGALPHNLRLHRGMIAFVWEVLMRTRYELCVAKPDWFSLDPRSSTPPDYMSHLRRKVRNERRLVRLFTGILAERQRLVHYSYKSKDSGNSALYFDSSVWNSFQNFFGDEVYASSICKANDYRARKHFYGLMN